MKQIQTTYTGACEKSPFLINIKFHMILFISTFLKRWIAGPMCNMSPVDMSSWRTTSNKKKRRLFKRVWDHKADQGGLKCRFFQDVLCFTGSVEGFTTDEWFEALIYLKFWRHTASAVVNLQNYLSYINIYARIHRFRWFITHNTLRQTFTQLQSICPASTPRFFTADLDTGQETVTGSERDHGHLNPWCQRGSWH